MSNTDFKVERTRHIITLVAIIASYLPFLILAEPPEATSNSIIFYLARQTGYFAAVMLLWQFILGTRSVSRLWLQDQVWALDIHKKLGMYGIFLVLAHPFLIAYDYGEGLDFIFTGDLSTPFGQAVAFGRMAFFLFLFVWLSSAIFRSNIGYRPWKYIHYLSYLIMLAVLVHVPDAGTFYAGSGAIQGLWSAMTLTFLIIVLIRISSLFTFGQRPYKLTAKKEIAEDVFVYTLEPQGKKVMPKPGQFIYLRRGVFSEEHPFTVARFNKDGVLQVAAKRFGKYTTKLSQTEIGSTMYVDGPYGVFTREMTIDPSAPATCIAGGIGITPFLQHVFTEDSSNTHLFYANRNKRNIVQQQQLQKILGDRCTHVLSDSTDGVSGAKQGYVTAEILQEKLGDAFSKQNFYICGPPIMMATVKKSLLESGIPKTQIHTEEFGY